MSCEPKQKVMFTMHHRQVYPRSEKVAAHLTAVGQREVNRKHLSQYDDVM
jgi:hypothetical protein